MLAPARASYKAPDPLAVATWRNSGHESESHDASEIKDEDYLWHELDGRCCFSGHWDDRKKGPNGGPKWISAKSCGQCQPDAEGAGLWPLPARLTAPGVRASA